MNHGYRITPRITSGDADGFFPTLSHLIALLLDWLRPGT
jgi:hypothetical protein